MIFSPLSNCPTLVFSVSGLRPETDIKKDGLRSQTVIFHNFGLILSRSQKYKNQLIFSKKIFFDKILKIMLALAHLSWFFNFFLEKYFFCLFYRRNKIFKRFWIFVRIPVSRYACFLKTETEGVRERGGWSQWFFFFYSLWWTKKCTKTSRLVLGHARSQSSKNRKNVRPKKHKKWKISWKFSDCYKVKQKMYFLKILCRLYR